MGPKNRLGASVRARRVCGCQRRLWAWRHEGQDFQHQGLIVTASAIPAIYLLAKAKITVANRIGSRALRADAVESIACAYLAAVVLIGPLGEWSSDSITSLAIVVFLVKDGREAWIGDDAEDGLADHRSSKVGGGWLRRRYQ